MCNYIPHLNEKHFDLAKNMNDGFKNSGSSSLTIFTAIEDDLKKVFIELKEMTSDDQRMFAKWINAELDNYAEKFFSNRVIKKTKIYFHDQLDDKTILTICKGILSDYDNEKIKIKKLRKNARAFFTEGKNSQRQT